MRLWENPDIPRSIPWPAPCPPFDPDALVSIDRILGGVHASSLEGPLLESWTEVWQGTWPAFHSEQMISISIMTACLEMQIQSLVFGLELGTLNAGQVLL